ncbi:MAG: hypothetical protein K2V38_01750, partial [Gemmataceae bacterium]|nr:hypothetical protein [Gemmataceae bacterium]
AMRGKPFDSPGERQLAVTAGTKGLTVAETVGVLAVEADRPTAAGRLLGAIPGASDFGSFAAQVEVSGRSPVGFARHADAGRTLPPVADRARVRDAVRAAVHAQAGQVIADRDGPKLDCARLEADIRARLKLAPETPLPTAEVVQALLDVCRDWAGEHARLSAASGELSEALTDLGQVRLDPDDEDEARELADLKSLVRLRQIQVLADRQRRGVSVKIGCQVLGEFGPDAAPARAWLSAQADADTPWQADARAALGK